MSGVVRGWCPNAWRPMAAGDGLLVRVRPRLGRMDADQLRALCEAALACGNGLIDATNRAGLQIRGVSEARWPGLMDRLVEAGLVDADPERERRATLVLAPDWQPGDDTHRIATELLARLDELPALPGKVGYAIDAGPAPVLGSTPADFRIERGERGALILRADGRDRGVPLRPGSEVDTLIALAEWFVASGGLEAGRVGRHHAPLPDTLAGTDRPAAAGEPIHPGAHPLGAALGLPFGRIEATQMLALLDAAAPMAMRLTPWRVLLFEGIAPLAIEGFVTDPAAISAAACPGAPACPQASVATRPLALRLAPLVAGRLHVSGCSKGCAYARPADVVLTGREGRFDIAFNARADDPPAESGRTADQLLARFERP
ncbi:cobalamin biosynthesis protein CobG [Sphingomonas sp. ac-8]|uniref:cobalamin biosynthesis protein CobG n=1 Tax=Sphingomonas sp. ac-8 TaxID=3242977 RepID=UPI003A8085F6